MVVNFLLIFKLDTQLFLRITDRIAEIYSNDRK